MGFFKKITKPFEKAAEVVTKPFAKITNKILPNELRFLAPYAAGIGSLMLPPTMSPWLRALASGGMNVAGQIASDESSTGDLSDINMLSTALASTYGAMGSNDFSKNMRLGIDKGIPAEAAGAMGPAELGMTTRGTGFLQGAENIGREGLASLGDYATGARQDLVNLGKNPGSLFSSANKFQGAKDAAKALAPTFSQATGDVAYEAGIDARNAIDAQDAADLAEFESTNKATGENRANLQMTMMRQADIPETTIVETLEMNDLGEYYSPPVETAAYGGLMGRNNYEFGGITEALKNAGSRGLMTENRAMGGMMNGYNMGGSVLPQGMEMDYRGGGFIPMGSAERADDVDARVSKNEFVMTADAVRAAGGGSVNEGARRMYQLMNNLEAKA
jgi:hypothetical protein